MNIALKYVSEVVDNQRSTDFMLRDTDLIGMVIGWNASGEV
jgi:hypothetical protein